jgi:hypothetical protein
MRPAALTLDAGTIASDSTGRKEITIDQDLDAGIYWLAAVAQAGSAGSVLVQYTSNIPVMIPGLSTQTAGDNATTSVAGFTTNGAETGALPGTITTLTYNADKAARVFVRVA